MCWWEGGGGYWCGKANFKLQEVWFCLSELMYGPKRVKIGIIITELLIPDLGLGDKVNRLRK